jgi:nucleoside-diphosphate-sugar epimerase
VADGAGGQPRVLVLGAAGWIGNHVARLVASEPGTGDGIFLDRVAPSPSGAEVAGQWASFDLIEEPERSLGRFLEDLGPVAAYLHLAHTPPVRPVPAFLGHEASLGAARFAVPLTDRQHIPEWSHE